MFAESQMRYLQDGLNRASVKPSFDEMQHFTAVSPVSHIANVKAPMLFMLGAKVLIPQSCLLL